MFYVFSFNYEKNEKKLLGTFGELFNAYKFSILNAEYLSYFNIGIETDQFILSNDVIYDSFIELKMRFRDFVG